LRIDERAADDDEEEDVDERGIRADGDDEE
jgi:hypothetical protein